MRSLLPANTAVNDNKYTLVLDIDETLISVRRWIDEVEIGQKILHKNKINSVIKTTKYIIFKFFDNSSSLSKTIQFTHNSNNKTIINDCDINNLHLKNNCAISDILYINNRKCSIISITTLNILLSSNKLIKMHQYNKNDLKYIPVPQNQSRYVAPDIIYKNYYLIRFRPGLCELFSELFYGNLSSYFNIILWTAAIRNVYSDIIAEISSLLLKKMNINSDKLPFKQILFRDNCTLINNCLFFKDISILNVPLSSTIIIDNREINFCGFENNLLPINDYYGLKLNQNQKDNELFKLKNILYNIQINKYKNISSILHQIGIKYDFSKLKLISMIEFQELMSLPLDSLHYDEYDDDIDDITISPHSSVDTNQSDDTINIYESSKDFEIDICFDYYLTDSMNI